jgi:hypothetical protein
MESIRKNPIGSLNPPAGVDENREPVQEEASILWVLYVDRSEDESRTIT